MTAPRATEADLVRLRLATAQVGVSRDAALGRVCDGARGGGD